MMEIRTLEYFLMVAKEENITHAANQLHIAQPSLSRALMQLEEEMGQQLFIRGKRKVTLTQAGVLFKRRAEEIMNLVDKTQQEMRNDMELNGEIYIGIGEFYATDVFLPELITSFSQKYPQVSYHFYSGNADSIKERIDHGTLDIGILLEPVEVDKYDFIRLPYNETWGLITSKDNSISSKEYVTSKDLINIPLTWPERLAIQNELISWFLDDYQHINFIATTNAMTNMIPLIKNNICSGINNEGAFVNHSMEHICFISLYPKLTTSTVLVWKKNQILSPLLQHFINDVYHVLKL